MTLRDLAMGRLAKQPESEASVILDYIMELEAEVLMARKRVLDKEAEERDG
jgi:hypothetical protein